MTSRQDASDDATSGSLSEEGKRERDASPGVMGEDALSGDRHPAFRHDGQEGATGGAPGGGADDAGERDR